MENMPQTAHAHDAVLPAATLVIKLGYRGAAFSGFAEQPKQRTVAGDLKQALTTVLRRPVELTCAGRTDAGVSALAQYVSVPVDAHEAKIPKKRLLRSLTALTDDDISIQEIYKAQPGFSARFDALARSYRYRISAGLKPVLAWDHAWWYNGALDVAAMNEAAQVFVGEHDFKSFCKALSAVDKPTHRYVESIQVAEVQEAGEKLIAIDIVGNAFLHTMVRTMVGTLVEVGRGHRATNWTREVLLACDRKKAGPTAPAKGLVFTGVLYPDGALSSWPETEDLQKSV